MPLTRSATQAAKAEIAVQPWAEFDCATVASASSFKDLLALNRSTRALKARQLSGKLVNPVGPEWMAGLGLRVECHSVQVVELPRTLHGELIWQVAAFFAGLRFNLRFHIRWCGTLDRGVEIGCEYARQILTDCTLEKWINEDWIASDGRRSVEILVLPLCK